MKLQLSIFIVLLSCFSGIAISQEDVPEAADSQSSYYLVRHAEKELNAGKDPNLTDIGRQRAQQWANILHAIEVDFVYSTNTTRTRDTAKPIAEQQGLEVTLYSPREFDYAAFTELHKGDIVVVVGHSNTTPAFANGLIGEEKYPELDESVYGNLYIVDLINGANISRILTINP